MLGRYALILVSGLFLQCPYVYAEPVSATSTVYDASVRQTLQEINTHDTFVRLITKQNNEAAAQTKDDILALDRRWRDGDEKLINPVISNDLSVLLATIVEKSNGLITEIIVMDKYGSNVAVSSVTTDYWQGDEDKWLKTFAVRNSEIFSDRVEFDLSTKKFSQQLSKTIFVNRKPIGAVTIGFDIRVRPKL